MSDNRDTKGRFGRGNKASPGRPKREKELEYLKITQSVVTPDEWREVVLGVLAKAKDGSMWHVRWLSDYLLGKPEDTVNVNSDQPINVIQLVYDENLNDNSGHSAE